MTYATLVTAVLSNMLNKAYFTDAFRFLQNVDT